MFTIGHQRINQRYAVNIPTIQSKFDLAAR